MHLLEIARAFTFEANLPIKFWRECILTATYIVNKLPSKVINFRTPFEIIFGHKLEYDHMRIFGFLEYVRNTNTKGDKFEVRGRPIVFIGYPQGKKGIKFMTLIHTKSLSQETQNLLKTYFHSWSIKKR